MIYNVYDLDVQAHCLYPKFTITIVITITKQPSCKKSVRPQKGHSGKRCEIQGGGQKITTIQVNLVPNPSETWRGQHKFT